MVRPYNLARQILKVPKFNCLGNVITDLGKCDAEIRRRIGVEKDTFQNQNKELPLLIT